MKYPITDTDRDDYANSFTYHTPKDNQPERFAVLRGEALKLAEHILENCPPSRERSLALTKLEECAFWANAAIARRE